MIQRFQIEEIISQDASGVVFRAVDSETGEHVALRRFFPFGAEGGGLHEDEQDAYHVALGRLAGIQHPAMRSVIAGGCDPVDGMPFIATEWLGGDTLPSLLKQGPLTAESAIALVSQALEVCELLSHVLAEDAVWIDTDPESVVICAENEQRPFTFWISPFKWLGGEAPESKGLESIIELTEEVMGWKGRIISEQAGGGLGGWIKWLRANATNTTLQQARQKLASAVGQEPPPPTEVLVQHATRPLVSAGKPPSRKKPVVIAALLCLAIAATITWWWIRPSSNAQSAATASSKDASAPMSEAERASRRAEQMRQELAQKSDAKPAKPAKKDTPEKTTLKKDSSSKTEPPARKDSAIPWTERERLVKSNGSGVTVTGTLHKFVRTSADNQHFINLEFSVNPGDLDARGCIQATGLPKEETEAFLTALVGKVIVIRGTVWNNNQPGKGVTPLIIVTKLSDITESSATDAAATDPIPWSEREKIISYKGKEIVIEGKVDKVEPSSSGKTLYLMNAAAPGDAGPRAGLEIGSQNEKSAREALNAFIGKNIRVKGKVVVRHIPRNGSSGVDLIFKRISDIQEVK